MTGDILFVDDDPGLRTVIPIALEKDGHSVTAVGDGQEALDLFRQKRFDLVIQDVRMPGMGGLELLEKLNGADAAVPVVVMTAFSTWDVAVNAMRLGAFDYIKKPFDNDDLRSLVKRAITYSRARSEANPNLADGLRIIGASSSMKDVMGLVSRVARTDSTVFIEGESGTGKELVARLLHVQSHRSGGPFIAVNCGGFSETLLESELFGHVKGAFTGASSDKRGLMELANGGTFFLDEVGEMSLSTQVRLLRVLETRTFFPVGGEQTKKTDARFVTATNRDLLEMSAKGTFRQDLYYRLNVVPIRTPPLRERREDIPLLAGHFLSMYGSRFNRPLEGFDPEATELLMRHDWPGNVRELQNAIQRAVSLAKDSLVTAENIQPSWGRRMAAPPPEAREAGEGAGAPSMPPLTGKGFDLEKVIADMEARYIGDALRKTGNNLTQAAELLGITFRSIRYKVKKMGLPKNVTRRDAM